MLEHRGEENLRVELEKKCRLENAKISKTEQEHLTDRKLRSFVVDNFRSVHGKVCVTLNYSVIADIIMIYSFHRIRQYQLYILWVLVLQHWCLVTNHQ